MGDWCFAYHTAKPTGDDFARIVGRGGHSSAYRRWLIGGLADDYNSLAAIEFSYS